MEINKDTPVSELYHARVARRESSKNHKYIRRYWSNGRWNYVYDENDKAWDKGHSRHMYTRNMHTAPLPKQWASDTNEWNGKFVKSFVDAEKKTDIDAEYADKFNPKYNPFSITRYKDPSWIVKVKDKLGYDEAYNYRKASDNKATWDDFARRSREEADRAYEAYKRLPDDYSYEDYQLAENTAQMTKADAETAGKLYVMSREKFFETPLGKVEKAKEDVRNWVDDAIDDVVERIKKRR